MIALNSVDNEKVAELYFHSLLGAYFSNAKIQIGVSGKDLRISVFWIQQSRTGKGEANKAFQKICEALNIKIATVTEITTAGLIGSIDNEAIAYNKRYNLSPDYPERTKMKSNGNELEVYKYQDPVIKGDLADYDILVFDEAKTLLQQSQYTENLLSNLQPALDYPGYVRKKLRHDVPIEYNCSPTIIATTYYFGEISKVLAEQGFFQRVVVYIRDMSINDIKNMRELQGDLMRNKNSKKLFEQKLKIFVKKLKKLDNNKLLFIQMSPEATTKLMSLGDKFISDIEKNLSGSNLYVALSFTNTLQEMALKIAAQYAILSGKNSISPLHIRQGFAVIKTYIDTIINKLEIKESVVDNEVRMMLNSFRKLAREKEEVHKTEFRDFLAKNHRWGKNKTNKKVEKLIYLNYLRQRDAFMNNAKILEEVR